MSRARARARRPSSNETTGWVRVRTDARNDRVRPAKALRRDHGGFTTLICGLTDGVPGASPSPFDTEYQDVLPAVVQRHILPGLEETHLANPLGGNPAGGEIGHASGFELQAHVGNIGFAGKNRQTHRANFPDRRIHKRKHHVEIVNHQVEHDIHIQRARREYAEPMDFEKHRPGDQRGSGANRGIESLQVSDLTDAAEALRQANQFVGVGQRGSQRLFHQNVNSGFHQSAGNLAMVDGGHGDGGGLHFTMRGDELFDRTKGPAAKFAGNGVGSLGIGVNDSHQPNCFALLRELVIDAGVVASEGAHADNRHVNEVVGCQFRLSAN